MLAATLLLALAPQGCAPIGPYPGALHGFQDGCVPYGLPIPPILQMSEQAGTVRPHWTFFTSTPVSVTYAVLAPWDNMTIFNGLGCSQVDARYVQRFKILGENLGGTQTWCMGDFEYAGFIGPYVGTTMTAATLSADLDGIGWFTSNTIAWLALP